MWHVRAERLIPGRGEPIEHGVVVFDRQRIAYAGCVGDAPPPKAGDHVAEAAVVMPGLWDCHSHFMGLETPDMVRLVTLPSELAVLRGARDAHAALMAGITSIRELGGHGVQLAVAAAEGTITAPRIYGAGGALSPTGGHADLHRFPLEVVQAHPLCVLADGVDSCLRRVREQLRRDAKVIKVCASGGVMSEVDHPIHQQFGDDELAAIVAEAARADRIVAAHCHGKPGIMAALRAGVRTIEHGTYLDAEAAAQMRERDAILVPTRYVIDQLTGMLPELPDYVAHKVQALAEQHATAMRLAIAEGVRIAMGTDLFVTGDRWGSQGRELGHLVDAGMSPLAAIEAATATAPATLGPQAPRSGQLAAGYDPDVITLDADPTVDIDVLADGTHVTGVWLAGRRVGSASEGRS